MLEIVIPQETSPGVVIRTDPQPRLLRSVPVLYPPPVDEQHDEIHLRQTHDGAVPNLYVALTHSGVTLTPLISELAALEVLEGAGVEMLGDYRPGRFA